MSDLRGALRSRGVRAALLVVAMLVVLAGWLLAAPPGASPDDGYHLGSIWCADGFKDGVCLEDPGAPDLSRVLVPKNVMGLVCFQYDGRQSAACTLDSLSTGLTQFIPVTGTNIRGERPNLYYRAMHVFVSEDLGSATARMRTANLLVVAFMVIATASVASARVRHAYLLSTIVAAVPLGLFLATSLNTSAWGLAGLTTLWANALTATGNGSRRNRLLAGCLVMLGLVLGLGSRTEAVAHVAVTAVTIGAVRYWSRLPVDSARRPSRLWMSRALLTSTLTLGAVAVMLLAPQNARLGVIVEDIRSGYDRLVGRGIGDPFLAIAFEVPSLWTGALGHIWGLGALDTPIPTLATLPLIGAFVALIVVGLQGAARARTVGVAIVGVSLFAFPTLSLMRSGLIVYEELQPRQFMVLLFILLGVALLRLPGEPELVISAGIRRTLIVALSLGHALALLVTMRRHTSGLVEFRYVSFTSDIEWWWASGPSPNVVWAIASLAYIVGVTVAIGMLSPEGSTVSSDAIASPVPPPSARS